MKHHHTIHLEGLLGKSADVREIAENIADVSPKPYRTLESYAMAFADIKGGVSKEDVKRVRISITVQEID